MAALARGRMDIQRLRTALSAVSLPRAADGRLVLAIDITSWLRPDAHTSGQRILCHTYGRGKDQHMMVPGWPYSVVVALETGRSSWTAPLDAVRPAPGVDAASVTAGQIRDLGTGSSVSAPATKPSSPDNQASPASPSENAMSPATSSPPRFGNRNCQMGMVKSEVVVAGEWGGGGCLRVHRVVVVVLSLSPGVVTGADAGVCC